MNQTKRPGVMLYFDLYHILKEMSMEEAYEILMAIFEFAQNGVVPTFRNPALTYAWGFIRQSVERDIQRYDRVVEQRRKTARKHPSKTREDTLSFQDADGATAYD